MIILLSIVASVWALAFGLSCIAYEQERRKLARAEHVAEGLRADLKGAVEHRDALLATRAHLLIQLSARDTALAQLAEIHGRDVAILRAALIDVHAALVADKERPEDRLLAGLVTQ